MKVEERDGHFSVWARGYYDPDVVLDLAEAVELRCALEREIMDYLARAIARLSAADTSDAVVSHD